MSFHSRCELQIWSNKHVHPADGPNPSKSPLACPTGLLQSDHQDLEIHGFSANDYVIKGKGGKVFRGQLQFSHSPDNFVFISRPTGSQQMPNIFQMKIWELQWMQFLILQWYSKDFCCNLSHLWELHLQHLSSRSLGCPLSGLRPTADNRSWDRSSHLERFASNTKTNKNNCAGIICARNGVLIIPE